MIHPFAEHLTYREAEEAWKWLKTLTQEEWDLVRRSPRCTHCGHLLVLQRWREAQTLTPAGHRKVLTCCAVGACPCEAHWLPAKERVTEMSQ